jgi:hypothetical protein
MNKSASSTCIPLFLSNGPIILLEKLIQTGVENKFEMGSLAKMIGTTYLYVYDTLPSKDAPMVAHEKRTSTDS